MHESVSDFDVMTVMNLTLFVIVVFLFFCGLSVSGSEYLLLSFIVG